MRFHHYNSIIALPSENAIMYNALTDKFFILNKEQYLTVNRHYEQVLRIKDQDYNLYLQLINNSFLVEDSYSEADEVDKLISDYDNDSKSFHLHINPTMDCICRCWYCYEDHLCGTKMESAVMESIKRFVDSILRELSELQQFQLSFFGGEPLMHYETIAKPLIEYINSLMISHGIKLNIHFTTNGILISDKILESLKGKNVSFQITLDGGEEYHNKVRYLSNGNGTYDKIITNIKKILHSGHQIILRINYTQNNYKSLNRIIEDLSSIAGPNSNNISVDFQRVWQDKDNNDDPELSNSISDYICLIRKLGFRITSHKVYDSVRNTCYGNRRNFVLINYNGDVFSCTARKFSRENRSGVLTYEGVIKWENDSLNNRMNIRFKKTVCRTCKIAPICGSGCRQHCIEDHTPDSQCSYNYTDEDMNEIILNRFEYIFLNKDYGNE